MPLALPAHIETERLTFRLPEPEDAETIFEAYCQDAEVCRFLVWLPHDSVNVTRDFIASCMAAVEDGSAVPYVLTLKDSGRVVGMVEARPLQLRINIGYVLARAYWGRGLMSEAVLALSHAALSGSFYRVEAACDVDNRASARILEKSGFAREGRLSRYMVLPGISPEPRDAFLYAVHR